MSPRPRGPAGPSGPGGRTPSLKIMGGASGASQSISLFGVNPSFTPSALTDDTNSIAFTAGKLYVLMVSVNGGGNGVSAVGVTSTDAWTKQYDHGTISYDFTIYSYVPASTHTEAVRVTWTSSINPYYIIVAEMTGFKTSGVNGSDAFIVNKDEERSTSGTTAVYNLAALNNANNYLVALQRAGTADWASSAGTVYPGPAMGTVNAWGVLAQGATSISETFTTSTGCIGLGFEMVPG